MIGDRVESDIAGAKSIGWDGALVLTGLSLADRVLEPVPDYILTSLRSLAVSADAPGGEPLTV